jgi:hypothetical protein
VIVDPTLATCEAEVFAEELDEDDEIVAATDIGVLLNVDEPVVVLVSRLLPPRKNIALAVQRKRMNRTPSDKRRECDFFFGC